MATPPAFSFQIHTCFLLGHFMLERSSHSVNANYFPFTWGNLSARQLVWAGCADLPSHGGDRTPWCPFRPVRAYVNSVDGNFLLFFFFKLCHLPSTVSAKYFITCVVFSIHPSAMILSLSLLLWIPFMKSYLLSAVFRSLQWWASLKRHLYLE